MANGISTFSVDAPLRFATMRQSSERRAMTLPSNPDDITAEYVIARLEAAGVALMGLPGNAPMLGQRVQTYGYVADMLKGAKPEPGVARIPEPNRAELGEMEEAFSWLALIRNPTIRRIVAARSLTKPHTGRNVFSWAKIAEMVGSDREAPARWYETGVGWIAQELRKGVRYAAPVGKYEREGLV